MAVISSKLFQLFTRLSFFIALHLQQSFFIALHLEQSFFITLHLEQRFSPLFVFF